MLPFAKTFFVRSIGKLSQFPAEQGIEIAFAGRSNAGKSSALNAITGVKNLAKTSKTPGRTQTINLFQVTPLLHLVDLPGYGYAQVPPALKMHWDKLLNDYLTRRVCLRGLILIMDIRHPLQKFDLQILNWAQAANLPVHILLTKADKLSRGAATQTLRRLMDQLSQTLNCTCQTFSSLTGEGVLAAKKHIAAWTQTS